MRAFLSVAALAALVSGCSASGGARAPQAAGPAVLPNTFHALLGARQFGDDDYWSPLDEQGVLAVEFAHEPPGAPVGFELGCALAGATDSINNFDRTAAEVELYGGFRKTFFREGALRPYLGAGLSLVSVAEEDETVIGSLDDDDASAGLYVHGGLELAVGDAFSLGLDARVLTGTDVELFGVSTDADYTQFALFFGWSL